MNCHNKECDDFNTKYPENCMKTYDTEACDKYKPLIAKKDDVATVLCNNGLCDADDYAYKTIAEFEGIVEYKVNDAFKAGWSMARTTNKQLGILAGEEEGT